MYNWVFLSRNTQWGQGSSEFLQAKYFMLKTILLNKLWTALHKIQLKFTVVSVSKIPPAIQGVLQLKQTTKRSKCYLSTHFKFLIQKSYVNILCFAQSLAALDCRIH